MNEIYNGLYQFTDYIPPMDFTIHNYLYTSEPSILFASGTYQHAESILPEIKSLLGKRSLKYIFVSHMESDEAGGISIIANEYRDVSVICSHLASRELYGFGLNVKIIPVKGGEILNDGKLKLRFIDYPSEVHLQDGLLCFEENSGILYSSDVMLSFGNAEGRVINAEWNPESISENRIPNDKLETMRASLKEIQLKFIAVGHGFCIATKEYMN